MLELLFLLLPIAAAYGWYMGHRSAKKDQEDMSNKLSRDYVTGVNFLLSNQTDKAVDLFLDMLQKQETENEIKKAADEMGINIKVETNGADGRKNVLTDEDIKKATGVILAINRNIEVDRFDGKPLIQVEAKEGINNAKALIQQVLDGKAPIFHASGSKTADSSESSV